MLTKDDIHSLDKLITKRIREEIEAEGRNIRDDLKSDIISSRMRIQLEISALADRIKNIEIRLNNSDKETKKNFQKLDQRFTDLFDYLDKDQLKSLKRIKRIEEHLTLEPTSI